MGWLKVVYFLVLALLFLVNTYIVISGDEVLAWSVGIIAFPLMLTWILAGGCAFLIKVLFVSLRK